jgi:5-methylcytosine-specific restriction endonuclease McrA
MESDRLLENPTLVLNKDWVPVQTTTTRKAIGLVAGRSARIIDPATYQVYDLDSWNAFSRTKETLVSVRIRSMLLRLEPPEVIVLSRYHGLGRRSVVFSRANLFRRDRYTCQYCGKRRSVRDLSIDHVIPRSQGGKSTWENCVVACIDCNSRKGGRTPERARMRLLSKPRKPAWRFFVSHVSSPRCESWGKFLSRAYWEVELES